MAPPQHDTDDTIAVDDDGETVEVPLAFPRDALETFFGGVPDVLTVRRVYRYDDVLRVEGVDDGTVYEYGYWPDGGHSDTLDEGWIGTSENVDPAELDDPLPGAEVLWSRDPSEVATL